MRNLTSEELRLISGGLIINLGFIINAIDTGTGAVGGRGSKGGPGGPGGAGGNGVMTLNGDVIGVPGSPGRV
jgi:hypothetical protein